MNSLQQFELEQLRFDHPKFSPGDTVKVYFRIIEGEKERIQIFQGVVLRIAGGGATATVTVRKYSNGVGVERIFPLHSPVISKIELVTEGFVRRSRLYYMRERQGKAARIRPKKTQ